MQRDEIKIKQTEKQIQDSIRRYLEALRIPHTVTDASAVRLSNGSYRASDKVDPSWPDISGAIPASVSPLLEGRMLAIECKTKSGRLRPGRMVKRGFRRVYIPGQAEVLTDLRKAGAVAFVARSIDDVIEGLRRAEQIVRAGGDLVKEMPELK